MRLGRILVIGAGAILPAFGYGPQLVADATVKKGWEAATNVAAVSSRCDGFEPVLNLCSYTFRDLARPDRQPETFYYAAVGDSWAGKGAGLLRARDDGHLAAHAAVTHLRERQIAMGIWLVLGMALVLLQVDYFRRLLKLPVAEPPRREEDEEAAEEREEPEDQVRSFRQKKTFWGGAKAKLSVRSKNRDGVTKAILSRRMVLLADNVELKTAVASRRAVEVLPDEAGQSAAPAASRQAATGFGRRGAR